MVCICGFLMENWILDRLFESEMSLFYIKHASFVFKQAVTIYCLRKINYLVSQYQLNNKTHRLMSFLCCIEHYLGWLPIVKLLHGANLASLSYQSKQQQLPVKGRFTKLYSNKGCELQNFHGIPQQDSVVNKNIRFLYKSILLQDPRDIQKFTHHIRVNFREMAFR